MEKMRAIGLAVGLGLTAGVIDGCANTQSPAQNHDQGRVTEKDSYKKGDFIRNFGSLYCFPDAFGGQTCFNQSTPIFASEEGWEVTLQTEREFKQYDVTQKFYEKVDIGDLVNCERAPNCEITS